MAGYDGTGATTSVPLSVALQDGFTGEETVVRLDGAEVLRTDTRTAWEISLATSFDIVVDKGTHTVELEIPARGIRTTRDVALDRPLWLGISVLDGDEVIWRESSEPFGYL